EQVGLETLWPWGISVGDFDNDGHQDVFLASGMGFPFYYWPNYLMLNNGDGTFSDHAEARGIEPPVQGHFHKEQIQNRDSVRSSRCAAAADFDGDGRLEIITNNFNDIPYYFKNEFDGKNSYLALRLQGTRSNRDAIGAQVKIRIGEETMMRLVQSAGGYLSQPSRTVHFGIGKHEQVDRVEIRWPSGIRQVIENPVINRLHKVVEPDQPVEKPAAEKPAAEKSAAGQ
ncbi:MAG: CRTAC1 family protein, partial [Planctomycetaceae bacterium]